jgi:hypothetical protein
VENLKLWLHVAKLKYFAELDAENLKKVYLRWENDPSVEDVLPVLKKFRYLQRMTLDQIEKVPSLEVLLDFIMEMKHLTRLLLAPMCDRSSCEQLSSFRDELFKLVSPHRPNFELGLTCDHSGCLT